MYGIIYLKRFNESRFRMKFLEKNLLRASGYSMFILFFLLLFTSSDSDKLGGITLETFILVFFFSLIISLSCYVFSATSIKTFWKVVINYTVLFTSFCIIFMLSGNLFTESPANLFSAIVIFTFLYALVFGATVIFKHVVKKADKKFDSTASRHSEKKKEKEKENTYKPLYKKD